MMINCNYLSSTWPACQEAVPKINGASAESGTKAHISEVMNRSGTKASSRGGGVSSAAIFQQAKAGRRAEGSLKSSQTSWWLLHRLYNQKRDKQPAHSVLLKRAVNITQQNRLVCLCLTRSRCLNSQAWRGANWLSAEDKFRLD